MESVDSSCPIFFRCLASRAWLQSSSCWIAPTVDDCSSQVVRSCDTLSFAKASWALRSSILRLPQASTKLLQNLYNAKESQYIASNTKQSPHQNLRSLAWQSASWTKLVSDEICFLCSWSLDANPSHRSRAWTPMTHNATTASWLTVSWMWRRWTCSRNASMAAMAALNKKDRNPLKRA